MADYIVTLKVTNDDQRRTSLDVRGVLLDAVRPLSRSGVIADDIYVRDITVAEVV